MYWLKIFNPFALLSLAIALLIWFIKDFVRPSGLERLRVIFWDYKNDPGAFGMFGFILVLAIISLGSLLSFLIGLSERN